MLSWLPWPAETGVAALFGDLAAGKRPCDLYAVLADRTHGLLRVGKATLDSDRFPSLTPIARRYIYFEREIAEQYGVCPEGHPWLKPVRFHASYRRARCLADSATPDETARSCRRDRFLSG